VVGSAPGRLDLLGGVADYAGALVLETPTRCRTTVTATPADELVVGPARLTVDGTMGPEALADFPRWTHYLLGVAIVLVRRGVIEPPRVELTVQSDVPVSVGVSSSAALEVATARALGADLDPLRLALLCQEAENHLVGAPCGVMDQVAVSLGVPGSVLPILCRPAAVRPLVPLAGREVVGWPTGVEHDVSGRPYRRARAAAFMGRRMLGGEGWISELTDVDRLPDLVSGAEFLDRWGDHGDAVTTVDETEAYPVRAATSFGVEEHGRCEAFLAGADPGPLMAASHAGYEAMGLGHPAADAVVAEALARPGVHGARSSGGGAGGTVVVLCDHTALDDVEGLIR
jgi:L-arabinokinase